MNYKAVFRLSLIVYLVVIIIESLAALFGLLRSGTMLYLLHFILGLITVFLLSYANRKYVREEHPEYWKMVTKNDQGFDNYWSSSNWNEVYRLDQDKQLLDEMRTNSITTIILSVLFFLFPAIF